MEENSPKFECDMCCEETSRALTFTCQHKICYPCFYKILIRSHLKDIKQSDTLSVKCVCQNGNINLNIDEIYQITLYLANLISTKKEKKPKKDNLTCLIHADKKLNFFCFDCKEEVCEKCIKEGSKHFSHNVITTEDYISNLKQNLNHFPNLDLILKSNEEHYKTSYDKFKTFFTKKIDDLIAEVNNYKKKVLDQVREKTERFSKSIKIINMLYQYFNYEMKNDTEDMHKLMFYLNTKIFSAEIDYHFGKISQKFDLIVKKINSIDAENLAELKLNQKFLKFECIQSIENAHDYEITSVALSKKIRIVTGDKGGFLKFWKMTKTGFILVQTEQLNSIQCITTIQSGVIGTSSLENTIFIWQENSEHYDMVNKVTILEGENSILRGNILFPNCLSVLNDHMSLISYINDQTIRIYENSTGTNKSFNYEETHKLKAGNINCIIQLKNGKILAGSDDSTIHIWNQDKSFDSYLKQNGRVVTLKELNESNFASSSSNKNIMIWEMKDSEVQRYEIKYILSGHLEPVRTLISFEDGRLVSGGEDNYIKVWIKNNREYECSMTIRTHKNVITGLVNVDQDSFLSVSSDKSIKMWYAVKNY